MGEMHPGDLLNLDMLKEAIEVPFEGFLWGQSRGMMAPYVCEHVFGDGLYLLTVSTINQRPNYHIVRCDSSWREPRGWRDFRPNPDHEIHDEIDDILTAIEDECGKVGDVLDEPCPDCGDEFCRCNVDSAEQFPALDEETGCSWGDIRWSWLMEAIGYPDPLPTPNP